MKVLYDFDFLREMKAMCREHDIGLYDALEKAGINYSTVLYHSNNHTRPSKWLIEKFCEALGESTSRFPGFEALPERKRVVRVPGVKVEPAVGSCRGCRFLARNGFCLCGFGKGSAEHDGECEYYISGDRSQVRNCDVCIARYCKANGFPMTAEMLAEADVEYFGRRAYAFIQHDGYSACEGSPFSIVAWDYWKDGMDVARPGRKGASEEEFIRWLKERRCR